MVTHPFEQALQHRFVLFEHKQPRALLRSNRQIPRNAGVEVTILAAVGRAVGVNIPVAPAFPHAHIAHSGIVQVIRGFIAKETFFQAYLRLRAQVVVHAGKHNDDFVAGIGCLAHQPGVVGRFAGLDVPHCQTAPVP